MARYVYRPSHPDADENGMVDVGLVYIQPPSAPGVISDTMPATRHMANGMLYDSKHKFREATRATGCVEVGNDRSLSEPKTRQAPKLDRRQRRDDIRRAIYQLRNR